VSNVNIADDPLLSKCTEASVELRALAVSAGKYNVGLGRGQPGTSAPVVEVLLETRGEYKLPE